MYVCIDHASWIGWLVQKKQEAAREAHEALERREQRREHRLEEAELAKRKVLIEHAPAHCGAKRAQPKYLIQKVSTIPLRSTGI